MQNSLILPDFELCGFETVSGGQFDQYLNRKRKESKSTGVSSQDCRPGANIVDSMLNDMFGAAGFGPVADFLANVRAH